MATAAIAFNPFVTTNAAGSFNATSEGFIQGMIQDNPVELFKIAGGVVDPAETIPMWGGIAITEDIQNLAAGNPSDTLGGSIKRSTTVGNTTGFTVYNQAQHMVTTPQSPVPLSGTGNSVHIVRLGSNTRLAVACDPSLAAIEGGAINQNVSWDFTNERLQPYDASTATIAITGATWANTSGGQITATVANWTGAFQPSAGDVLAISGATNSGTGGAGAVNRSFVVVSATSTQAVLAAPAAAGVIATIGGSPVFNFGTGALNVRVLRFNFGNSMTVVRDPDTGFVTWNRSGSTAIILV